MLRKVNKLYGNDDSHQRMHNNVYETIVTNIRQHHTLSTPDLPTQRIYVNNFTTY
jgi:hypothetical protein